MTNQYIEREAAKRELLSWAVCMNHPEYLMRDDALHVIDSIPAADVVGVVRCRECKYHEDTHVIGFEHCCLYDLTMRHNDFCSYGKRAGFDELAATTGSTVYKTTVLDTEYDCFNELIRYNDIVFAHSTRDKKGE